MRYRRFRNDDPPALAAIWNESLLGRGAYQLRSSSVLDRFVFSKPYFEPEALTVAEGDSGPVGFSLAGFGASPDMASLDFEVGVTCAVVVRPEHRRRGVGTGLLRAGEAYLRARGARRLYAGPMEPHNPYGFGLYGGSGSPGFLCSDPAAAPFLEANGYVADRTTLVFQRKLDQPINVVDSRFSQLRRRYAVDRLQEAAISNWWRECMFATTEPIEFRLEDRLTRIPAARALVWEMDGFSSKWNYPAAGLLDVQVRPDLRRLGLAKFLLSQVLRYLQEQFFGIAEVQAQERNPAAVALLRSLGFEQVDVGRSYRLAADPGEPAGGPGAGEA
ncbi:MAG TPA: GNAT family N-acetyltransferase [Gemmataceae bacterium]